MGLLEDETSIGDKTDYSDVRQGIKNYQSALGGLLGMQDGSVMDGTSDINNYAQLGGLAFGLPIYQSAKTPLEGLLNLGRKGQSAAKEVIGLLTPEQKSVLAAAGIEVENITARNLGHLSEKIDKSFLPSDKADWFGTISKGADEGTVASVSDKQGSPRLFNLTSSDVMADERGKPFSYQTTFKVLGNDADLYSAGRSYKDKNDWFRSYEKRYRR